MLDRKLWKQGKPGLAVTTEELVVHIPPGYIRKNKAMYLETDIEAADREPDLNKLSTSLEALITRTRFFHWYWLSVNGASAE